MGFDPMLQNANAAQVSVSNVDKCLEQFKVSGAVVGLIVRYVYLAPPIL